MKRVKLICAHCDDELLWGYPIIQDYLNKNIESLEILCCSSDLYNSERSWCKNRRYVLESICNKLNIPVTILNHNSEFYRANTRNEELKNICQNILNEIDKTKFDYIATHNQIGEYGNLDHILLHNLITNHYNNVLTTDIVQQTNWLPLKHINFKMNQLIDNYDLDMDLFTELSNMYKEAKVWTWSKEPIKNCNLLQCR